MGQVTWKLLDPLKVKLTRHQLTQALGLTEMPD